MRTKGVSIKGCVITIQCDNRKEARWMFPRIVHDMLLNRWLYRLMSNPHWNEEEIKDMVKQRKKEG